MTGLIVSKDDGVRDAEPRVRVRTVVMVSTDDLVGSLGLPVGVPEAVVVRVAMDGVRVTLVMELSLRLYVTRCVVAV